MNFKTDINEKLVPCYVSSSGHDGVYVSVNGSPQIVLNHVGFSLNSKYITLTGFLHGNDNNYKLMAFDLYPMTARKV